VHKNSVTRGYGLLETFLAKKRADMANRLIPRRLRKGRILDIGCGSTPFFLINTEFKEKYGIDYSVSRSNSKNLVLKNFDLNNSKMPFRNNFFETVIMLAVVEHMERDKLPALFKEVARILKPGGRFIITTPCPWAHFLLRLMARFRLVSPIEIKEHKYAYDKNSIAAYFDNAGFKSSKMKFGYFELFLNNWAYVDK